MAEVTYISYSARAKSTTADGIFAEAHQILDVSKNKNQQAINAEVTTELGKKVAKSDFDSFKTSNTSAIAAKADKSYVDTELKKKANAADVQNVQLALGQKVNTSDFNEHKTSSSLLINAKADKTYVNTELGKKANSADVYTKAQADSAITAKVNAAVASVYRVKGTKATIAEVTALTNVKCGDVWNVTAEFTLGGKKYPAGTNVVALADKSAADPTNWDALGGTVDLAGHTAEMKSWANGQFAGKAYEAKVTTNTSNISSLTTRVGAVETKATTNASNISSLTTRVTAAEGKFAGYYTKGETDTKLGTKANSADVYTKSQVYTKGEVDGKVGAAKMQKILITDLDKETLDKLKADASRACMQVVDASGHVLGVLFQYSDSMDHVLTQEFHTHCNFTNNNTFDGTTAKLTVSHNHNECIVLSRNYSKTESLNFTMSRYVGDDLSWLTSANAIQEYFKLFGYDVSKMPTGQQYGRQVWLPWRHMDAENSYFINKYLGSQNNRIAALENLLKLA